jgi:tyrosyl-tRNA synthetase
MQTYRAQAAKVLDLERISVRYNSEWLDRLGLADLVRLLSKTTVAQMLERNDFRNRYADGTPIALHEFLYPVAQAYDSIAIGADVELGGSDQLFNLLLGRQYQREWGQLPQICATVPLLVGTDGQKKMSKSFDNFIGVTEAPNDQFGKIMRIGDEQIPAYARLTAFRARAECDRLEADLLTGRANPMEEKKRIAQEVVARYHGSDQAAAAREYFERTVQAKEIPTDGLREIGSSTQPISGILVVAGLAASKRDAERLISQRAVKIDGTVVTDRNAVWEAAAPAVLSVGSRKFVRLRPEKAS